MHSYVPEKYKFNLVFTLVYRLYRIASSMTMFHMDLISLKKRLLNNGFPNYLIDTVVDKVLTKFHVRVNNQTQKPTVPKREVKVFLPYLGLMSYTVKRNLIYLVHRFYPSVNLQVVFLRGYKIANMFSRKDRFPLSCRSLLVYYIECTKCGSSQAYLGKTKNSLYERFFQSGIGHLHPNNANSALLNHLNETDDPDCSFQFENVKVVETGRTDLELRYIESILLKFDKQTLNTQERSIKLNII